MVLYLIIRMPENGKKIEDIRAYLNLIIKKIKTVLELAESSRSDIKEARWKKKCKVCFKEIPDDDYPKLITAELRKKDDF